MKDLFWTIIIAWFAWQLVNIFRRPGLKQKEAEIQPTAGTGRKKPLSGKRKMLDNEGDFVDFEEIR